MKMFVHGIERMLEPVFIDLPPLSKHVRQLLVEGWPWLALVLGIVQLVMAWQLWHLGHSTNEFVNYVNDLARSYGSTAEAVPRLNLFYWIDLMLLIACAVLLMFAVPGLQARRKEGWELLFLAALAYLLYGVIALFDGAHGGILKFLGVIMVILVTFYLLFQIRDQYAGRHIVHHEKQLPSIKDK